MRGVAGSGVLARTFQNILDAFGKLGGLEWCRHGFLFALDWRGH